MKKLILLFSIAMFSFTTYGQSETSWRASRCYKGIQYKIQYEKDSYGDYEAYAVFRNLYKIDVSFTFDMKGGSYESNNNYFSVKSGETKKTYMGRNFTSTDFYISVYDGESPSTNGVAPCDNY